MIAARRVLTAGRDRLLVRRVFLAADGVEFIHGRHGYALTALFVVQTADWCRDNDCVWLSVHNHGPGDRVTFSRALIEISQAVQTAVTRLAYGSRGEVTVRRGRTPREVADLTRLEIVGDDESVDEFLAAIESRD